MQYKDDIFFNSFDFLESLDDYYYSFYPSDSHGAIPFSLDFEWHALSFFLKQGSLRLKNMSLSHFLKIWRMFCCFHYESSFFMVGCYPENGENFRSVSEHFQGVFFAKLTKLEDFFICATQKLALGVLHLHSLLDISSLFYYFQMHKQLKVFCRFPLLCEDRSIPLCLGVGNPSFHDAVCHTQTVCIFLVMSDERLRIMTSLMPCSFEILMRSEAGCILLVDEIWDQVPDFLNEIGSFLIIGKVQPLLSF